MKANYSKHSAIVSSIKNVCDRFPKTFDSRLLRGFERIVINSSIHFIDKRSISYLYRLILAQYFLQKKIEQTVQGDRNQKHRLFLRLLHQKSRLCFLFTFSLDQEKVTNSQYFLKTLQTFIPGIQEVPCSSFRWLHPDLPYLVGYFEFQKLRGQKLSSKQVRSLEKSIRKNLLYLMPDYTPAVFWPYNAEESYRQILTLQQEIDSPTDLPHASIQFKGQTSSSLEFIIQLATPSPNFSLDKVVHKLPSSVQLSRYTSRIQEEGLCPLKSYIFSLHIPENQFFENGTINLVHARRLAAKYLEVLIGPFRDYNGGLLEKQFQQFDEIKARLTTKIPSFHRFAENLFYSLRPIEAQFSLSFEKIEALFILFSSAFNQKTGTIINDSSQLILVVKSLDVTYSAHTSQEMNQLSSVYGECVLAGFHYLCLIAKGEVEFIEITDLLQKKSGGEEKVLRLNFLEGPPVSLNPHYTYDAHYRVLSKLLFKGLVCLGAKDKVMLTGAAHFSQQDPLTYLFKIRPHFWSNGEKVTAYHYEHSWKQALSSPDISSELFFTLKAARKIHEHQQSLDDLGVEALDETVLKISLEHPDPFLFEKLAHPLFFPKFSPTQQEPEYFNGPYLLHKKNNEGLILERNPYFWQRSNLYFDKVAISYLQDPDQILDTFKAGKIHWIGSPFNRIPINSIHQIKKKKLIRPFLIYFNTRCAHFSSKWIRQALSLSINRSFITNSILIGDAPLYSPLPDGISLKKQQNKELSMEELTALFKKGLRETGYSLKQFPPIALMFYQRPDHINLAMYLKKRWESLFNITINLHGMNWNQLCDRLDKREFQLGGCVRSALCENPLDLLFRFERATSLLNFSSWEDALYQNIIREAQKSPSLGKRNRLLRQAENTLIDSMPVIPIVNRRFIYAHHPNLKGFQLDHGGCVDFTQAYFE